MTGDTWQSLLDRAATLRREGREADAIAAYEQLLQVNPNLPDSWYNLAWLQRRERQFVPALGSYAEALRRGIADPQEIHLNRAVILADDLHRPDDAEEELQSALRIDPRYVPALLNLGNLHEDRGERSAAGAAYDAALAADPSSMLALARLAGVSDAEHSIIARLRVALEQPDLSPADRADLGFALGRLLDAAEEYDGAFAAYAAANRASRGVGRAYDAAAHQRMVDRLIAAFATPELTAPDAERAPIFICGMFRSGSSLVEQILASHDAVTAGGELDLVPAIVRRIEPYPEGVETAGQAELDALRGFYRNGIAEIAFKTTIVTDKRPDNFLHIGLIKRLFPDAKIVHTVRNPFDNLLSLYFLHLNPEMAYALDLADAAHWYRQYRRLMNHWKALYPDDILDFDYDALVHDPQPKIARLLEFCGLGWQDSCLDFHRAARPVKTASVWQVREPLHVRSSGRWRHYERHLEPLRRALGDDYSE